MNLPRRIHLSPFVSIPFGTLIYALSGAAVGLSAFPSALVMTWAARTFLAQPLAGHLILFCLIGGGCLYLLLFCGLLLTGTLMRLLSLGVRPGVHRLYSAAAALWMGMNGVQTIATRLFLPVVPAGYFPTLYLRLAGCRIGAQSLICAGVTIEDGASVGIRTFLRKGTRVAAGAHVAAVGALAPREVVELERAKKHRG